MIFRIFIGFIALLCVFLAFDSGRIAFAKLDANSADEAVVFAPEQADITVVEFLDYACGPCQALHPVLMRALEQDSRIRYIVLPVASDLGERETQAAKLVYAAGRQGQFAEAHKMLIENYRMIDSAYISNFALELGLDTQKLEADIQDANLDRQLEKNAKALQRMKGRTVPALLINGSVLLSVTQDIPTSDELLSLFNRARTL